jgi:hypothetical protein
MAKQATVVNLPENANGQTQFSVAQLEAMLKQAKENQAKLLTPEKVEEIHAYLEECCQKRYNLSLSDVNLAEKTKRKAPETRTYKNAQGETYVYKGWGAVSQDTLKKFGFKDADGKMKLNPALLQPQST